VGWLQLLWLLWDAIINISDGAFGGICGDKAFPDERMHGGFAMQALSVLAL